MFYNFTAGKIYNFSKNRIYKTKLLFSSEIYGKDVRGRQNPINRLTTWAKYKLDLKGFLLKEASKSSKFGCCSADIKSYIVQANPEDGGY